MPSFRVSRLFVKNLVGKICLKFAKNVKKLKENCSLEEHFVLKKCNQLYSEYDLEHIVCHVW